MRLGFIIGFNQLTRRPAVRSRQGRFVQPLLWLVAVVLVAACSGSSDTAGRDAGDASSAAATSAATPAADGTAESSNDGGSDDAGAGSADTGDTAAGATEESAPRPALSIDEATAQHGDLSTEWPGPIFTEYVCDNLPHEHIEAVVGVLPAGEQFEFGLDGACRVSAGDVTMRIAAIGTENYEQEYAVRQELLSGDQPVAGFGDLAVEIPGGGRQTLLILDGDIVWQIEGGGRLEVPRDQFHAMANVLLTRFDPETRVDAVAEPVSDNDLAQVTALFQDWHRAEDAYFDDPATEADLRALATQEAAVAIVTRRNSNQRQLDEGIGGWTYQIQQLENIDARWYRGTSRGDIIVAATCVNVERGQPEGRDPIFSSVSQTIRVIANGDAWLIDEPVEGSGLTGSTSCS